MTDIDKLKIAYNNGDITPEQTIKELFNLLDYNKKFIDNLLVKYNEQKTQALKNIKTFKDHPEYRWYDSSLNHMIVMIHDLEDIKCRSGLFDDDLDG